MESVTPQKILNRAASQCDRQRGAPQPENVLVDGRSLAQLLAFAAEYGSLINFFDLSDRPDGDWTQFFTVDPSIALALIVCLDLKSIATESQRGIRAIRATDNSDQHKRELRRLVSAILPLIGILDTGQLATGPVGAKLAKAIRWEIHGGIATQLQRFSIQAAASAPEHGLRLDLAGLSPVWRLDSAAPPRKNDDVTRSKDWIEQIVPILEDLIAALTHGLQNLSEQAAAMLETSLVTEGHPPQSALYVAFAICFQEAQNSANNFPRELVDFYYGTILKQDSRAALGDQLYLTFTPAKDVAEAAVPKDTHFPAGVDGDGQTIAYVAEKSLPVYPTSVSDLRTLQVTSEPLIVATGPFDPVLDTAAPGRVLSGIVSLSDKPPAIAKPFAPFGDSAPASDGVLTTSAANLGFALASPALMLGGGVRTVHLLLTVDPASFEKMQPKLQAIGKLAGGKTASQVLAHLLHKGFVLTYSTGGGWLPVESYRVQPPVAGTAENAFDLSFTLESGAEPFVSLTATPPSKTAAPLPPGVAAPDTDQPVLLAQLVQDRIAVGSGATIVTVYPYAILSELALAEISIEVSVDNFTALTLSTPNGPIDPTKPFALFGSPPVQGGGIGIAAPELFAKRLDVLSLSLGWYSLPQTGSGFEGYYQGYVVDLDGNTPTPPIDNRSFLAAFSVRNPGLWDFPPQASPPASPPAGLDYLFRTDVGDAEPQPDKPVLSTSDFTALPVVSRSLPPYYDATTSAIQFVLAEPGFAFGDTLYARNVMAAAMQEASLAAACAQKCAKPIVDDQSPAAMLEPIAVANSSASDQTYREAIAAAIDKVLPQLTGTALKSVNDALAKLPAKTLDTAELDSLRASLNGILAQAPQGSSGVLARLSQKFDRAGPDAVDVTRNLSRWTEALSQAIGPDASAELVQAQSVLAAAEQVAGAADAAATSPPAAARPQVTAALLSARAALNLSITQSVQHCIHDCMGANSGQSYPNAPWLPMVSSLSLGYGAHATLPAQSDCGNSAGFYYLLPFGEVASVDWSPTVPLLAPQSAQREFYIGLSGAPANPALLFELTTGPDGWSDDLPPVAWSQQTAAGWTPLTPPEGLQGDGTDGFANSGIVTLQLQPPVGDAPVWLRLSTTVGDVAFPWLAGVTTNALMARWIGPGGAANLGVPLPAGTITASAPKLADIATIAQPLPSFGGRPFAKGQPFDMWMAERLRHKDRGIQDWDYARLALAEYPTLWQAAVVPASDAKTDPSAGAVRVVVVPGPDTPNIADTTAPLADPIVLAGIGDMLSARISPFIALQVANPPYVRLTVHASLAFSDADTVAVWKARLNGELVQWLSPWPPAELGPRPANYYDKFAIAEFIRRRSYVVAILSLDISYDPPTADWCYLTSALQHDLQGAAAS